jgi:hypothetical protein
LHPASDSTARIASTWGPVSRATNVEHRVRALTRSRSRPPRALSESYRRARLDSSASSRFFRGKLTDTNLDWHINHFSRVDPEAGREIVEWAKATAPKTPVIVYTSTATANPDLVAAGATAAVDTPGALLNLLQGLRLTA